jgi:hypothetical protein
MLYRCGLNASVVQPESQSVDSPVEGLHSLLFRELASKCFQSAGELIEVIHHATVGGFYGAWWYGVFCEHQTMNYAGRVSIADLLQI